jgi:hypothetical protein
MHPLSSRLRTVAEYQSGTDLPARLAHIENVIATQRASLIEAADEIERLTAQLEQMSGQGN